MALSGGIFSNNGAVDKRRREDIYRDENFERYLKSNYDLLSSVEKITLPKKITGGKNFGRFLLTRHLDSKLAFLNHIGKSTVIISFDKKEGLKWSDFKKAFSVYLSEEDTIEADKVINEHKFFCITPRGVGSWLSASSLYFDTQLYRPAQKRKKFGNEQGGRLMSASEHIQENKKVFKLLFRFLVSADNLNLQLEPHGLDFSQFVALGKLYFTSKPLRADELVTKSLRGKTLGKSPRGNYAGKIKALVDLLFVYEHKLEKEPVHYSISTKGVEVFTKILLDTYEKSTEI